MTRAFGAAAAQQEIQAIQDALPSVDAKQGAAARLFDPKLRLVLMLGLTVGVLQQITGINAVFFYAPMIFEQSGIGTDAAFLQAVLVGLANLIFTVVAMIYIDRIGRRPLLLVGVAGITASMFLIAWEFSNASYLLTADALTQLDFDTAPLSSLIGVPFSNDVAFKTAVAEVAGDTFLRNHSSALITASISLDPAVILIGILAFVSSFAASLGPVMWVLFSELFPNRVRGVAISLVGFANAAVSFFVQFSFPWELDTLGSALTFSIYGAFAAIGLLAIALYLPETKGKSLEELELMLAR